MQFISGLVRLVISGKLIEFEEEEQEQEPSPKIFLSQNFFRPKFFEIRTSWLPYRLGLIGALANIFSL